MTHFEIQKRKLYLGNNEAGGTETFWDLHSLSPLFMNPSWVRWDKSSLLRNNIVTGRGWWKKVKWLCGGAVLLRECDQPSISIFLCIGPCKLFLSPSFKTVKKIVCKTLPNCIALYQESLCPWAFWVIDFNMFFLGLFSTILKNIICASSMHVLLLILWYALAPWYSKKIKNLKKHRRRLEEKPWQRT